MSVNLSNFECIYTSKEYDKIFNKIKKKIITDNKKSKKPICRIFTGPPGSGKSRIANKYKNNIDVDTIVNELNESKELKKLNVKHGNVIESCIDIATRIGDDLTDLCIYKKYNFSFSTLYGTNLHMLYYLNLNSYKINVYYIYTFNAYENNKNRKDLNLSKKIYCTILNDMVDTDSLSKIFMLFSIADTFEFIKVKSHKPKFIHITENVKDWKLARYKIIWILKKVKNNI